MAGKYSIISLVTKDNYVVIDRAIFKMAVPVGNKKGTQNGIDG